MRSRVIIIALYLVVAANARTVEQEAKLLEYRKLCDMENDVSRHSAKSDKGYYSADGLGCITACIWKRIGIMNVDGTFNKEVARSALPDVLQIASAEKFITTCMNDAGANDCETGFQLLKCYIKNKVSLDLP